jgi:hypothetical protein
LAGSEGDQKAINDVIDTYEKIGFPRYEIQTQSFLFSDFYSTVLIKLIMMLSLMDMFLIFIILYAFPIWNFFVILSSAIPVYFLVKGLRTVEKPGFIAKYWGKMIQSQNVFVKIPAKKSSQRQAGNIIFSGHIDTKSQTYSTRWRILAYKIWLYSGFFAAFFLVFDFLFSIGWSKLLATCGICVIMIDNIFLLLLCTGDKSTGAIDNASGMSCVFEIARYFKENPLDNYNVWCCQFGAEELGTMGSRNFVNKFEDLFVAGKIFQFNFDMIGQKGAKYRIQMLESYGIPPRNISPILTKSLKKAAADLGLEIKGFYLSTGAHTDSVPFHQRKWDAIDIGNVEATRYAHTIKDKPNQIDTSILKEACLITTKAAIRLDKIFEEIACN